MSNKDVNYYYDSFYYIIGKKQWTEEDIEKVNKLSSAYFFTIYYYSNPSLFSYMIQYLNNYNIFKLKPIDIIDYLKQLVSKGIRINFPKFIKRKSQNIDKEILKIYDKLRFKNSKDEIYLTKIISEKENNLELKNFIEESLNDFKKRPKKNKKLIQEIINENIQKTNVSDTINHSSNKIGEFKIGYQNNTNINHDNGLYAFKLPNEFIWSKEWVLVDIRDYFDENSILMYFRNSKTNERICLIVNNRNYYYCYLPKYPTANPILKIEDTSIKFYKYKKDIPSNCIVYDQLDVKQKAALDYYFYKKQEDEYKPFILYFDIEVGTGIEEGALDTITTPLPITYVSIVTSNGDYFCYVLNGNENRKYSYFSEKLNKKVTVFEYSGLHNEINMLIDVINMIYYIDPDIITSWNGFLYDFPYLYNRCNKLGIAHIFESHPRYPSIKGKLEIESGKYSDCRWTFFMLTDMMHIYKSLQRSEKESWSLEYISSIELEEDKRKFKMPNANDPITDWIDYNIRDSEAMWYIDKKVAGHHYNYTMMKLAHTYWYASTYSNGLITGFISWFAKKNNLVIKTSKFEEEYHSGFFDKVYGGFNKSTTGGLFKWIVDYDASSMYPSLIRTFNIGPNTLRYTIKMQDALKILTNQYDPDEEIDIIEKEIDIRNRNVFKIKIKNLLNLIKEKKYYLLPSGGIFCNHNEEESIYFRILTELYDRRQYIRKNLLYDKNGNKILARDIEQLAIKIAMNSFYGVFGYKKFLFYNLTSANSITLSGRLFIKVIMYMIENYFEHFDKKQLTSKYKVTTQEIISAIKDKEFKLTEQDTMMHFKYAIYADTDGTAVTYQDFMFSEDEKTLDEQIDFIKILIRQTEDVINTSCYLITNLLAPTNDKHQYMAFKQEWIAYKGIFYANIKKRYILWLIYENGKKCSKDFYTGVDIKRSEYPQILKDRLKELVRILMKYEKDINIAEFMNRAQEIEFEFFNLLKERKTDLCKNVNFSKSLSLYKNRPQHIDGMLLYNKLVGYDYFKSGTKGKLVNIRQINLDKIPNKNINLNSLKKEFRLNNIVIPHEMERIPNFIEIDIKGMIQKIWFERYQSIFEPIFNINDKLDDFDDFEI